MIDGELPSCFTTTIRTARRNHRCCECYVPIEPGHQYQYVSGIWDGSPSSFKTCIPCVAARKETCPDGYLFGGLAEAVNDALDDGWRPANPAEMPKWVMDKVEVRDDET